MRKKGTLTLRNGKKYEGEFKNDLFHGQGKLIMIDKNIEFEGKFTLGECSKNGTLKYMESKEKYEGDIDAEFKKHGQGKYWMANGDYFEGQFDQDYI